jgi:hypothetical protein
VGVKGGWDRMCGCGVSKLECITPVNKQSTIALDYFVFKLCEYGVLTMISACRFVLVRGLNLVDR